MAIIAEGLGVAHAACTPSVGLVRDFGLGDADWPERVHHGLRLLLQAALVCFLNVFVVLDV